MTSDVLVSITVCTFNGEEYLRDTLASIFTQTHENIEIIVVDDGSTDGTRGILEEEAQRDKRVNLFFQANGGLAAARNAAFGHCSGAWIAIIDQDDLCYPNRIEEQLKVSLEHPSADLIFCNTDYINARGEIVGNHLARTTLPFPYIKRRDAANLLLTQGCYVDSESLFLRNRTRQQIGDLDQSLKYVCDYEYFVRIGFRSDFAYTAKSLCAWRLHPLQATNLMSIRFRCLESMRVAARYFFHSGVTPRTRCVLVWSMLKVAVRIAESCLPVGWTSRDRRPESGHG